MIETGSNYHPRVAYFPDSFHEVNGVAHTSRNFEAFARRRNLPFLCVRAGDRAESLDQIGNVQTLELPRGIFSFALEKDLRFDPAYLRHVPDIVRTLKNFQPDVIHITGPSELGVLGASLAHHLDVPLVASWHTNVHEYAARRSEWFLKLLSPANSTATARRIEDYSLVLMSHFYALAKVLLAPNVELCSLLENSTKRPCYLMPRGVETDLFTPEKRNRAEDDKDFVLGFVGRLSVEKNVDLLITLHDQLIASGMTNFRFLIVGHGAEEQKLREQMQKVEFTGVLYGDDLARAYANMDLFVFPSHTDTFGNVVLEALASGVPAVVTPDGGPHYIVRDGVTGIVAADSEFPAAVRSILTEPGLLPTMRAAAREYALSASWDAVFEGVYKAYSVALEAQAQPVAS
jgi:glycosyltransferase involved in cell wall biosynthesis